MGNQSRLDMRLPLARRGFNLFPLQPNLKTPTAGPWKLKATHDPAKLDWLAYHYNLAVSCEVLGDGPGALVVIDLDRKHGKDGRQALDMLILEDGEPLPRTFTVATPSGGAHLYFKHPIALASSAGKLGAGIDIRSKGGYVVGPTSTLDNGAYLITDDAPVADLPPWLAALIGAPKSTAPNDRTRESRRGANVVEWLDSPASIERARRWLAGPAPEAIEGAQGDHITFAVAAKVKDFGCTEATTLELLADHWNDVKASPPWPYDALAIKVAGAFRYGANPPGSAMPERVFTALPDPDNAVTVSAEAAVFPAAAPAKRRQFNVRPIGGYELRSESPYLVKGLIGQETLICAYGYGGSGKTFTVLHIAAHIALGRPWNGRKVRQGLVVYIAAEASGTIDTRLLALRSQMGVDDFPLYVIPELVNLGDPKADALALIEAIQELERSTGQKCVLTIVDTVARTFGGGDESSASDMGRYVQVLDVLRTRLAMAVWVVHHTGKDQTRGSRGSSALPFAVDTEIFFEKPDEPLAVRHAVVTRQKDMASEGDDITYRLQSVTLGQDSEGDPITSLQVILASDPAFAFGTVEADDPPEQTGPSLADEMVAVLAEMLTSSVARVRDGRAMVRERDWLNDVRQTDAIRVRFGNVEAMRKAVYRAQAELVRDNRIEKGKDNFIWLPEIPPN